MKNKYTCAECGNKIIFDYETPTKSFRIENGSLIRDDNNLVDHPELIPYCSYDKEHTIEAQDDLGFYKWIDEVEFYFEENGLYE